MVIHFLCPYAGVSTLALLTPWSEAFFVVGECESPCSGDAPALLPSVLEALTWFPALSPAARDGGGVEVGVGQSHS